MTHTIENSNNELLNLMQKVKDQAERSKAKFKKIL